MLHSNIKNQCIPPGLWFWRFGTVLVLRNGRFVKPNYEFWLTFYSLLKNVGLSPYHSARFLTSGNPLSTIQPKRLSNSVWQSAMLCLHNDNYVLSSVSWSLSCSLWLKSSFILLHFSKNSKRLFSLSEIWLSMRFLLWIKVSLSCFSLHSTDFFNSAYKLLSLFYLSE